jgi:hypothetical protein
MAFLRRSRLPSRRGIPVPSSLWIDQPDALERIESKRRAGELSEQQAATASHFVEHGYAVVSLELASGLVASLLDSVEALWRQRPADVAYAYRSPPKPMSLADERTERRPGHRLHDIHSRIEAALDLYLHRPLFDLVEILFGEPAVAIQSLYFEHGSEQHLHPDVAVVPVDAPGHLVAAWIALEDVSEGAGELIYVPGSHRLPRFEFGPGDDRFDAATADAATVEAALAFEGTQLERHPRAASPFLARRGDAILWHASLRHGGAPVRDARRTRRSFVVHYSTQRTYRRRGITLSIPGATPRSAVDRPLFTDRLYRNDCRGFENPVRGWRERESTRSEFS